MVVVCMLILEAYKFTQNESVSLLDPLDSDEEEAILDNAHLFMGGFKYLHKEFYLISFPNQIGEHDGDGFADAVKVINEKSLRMATGSELLLGRNFNFLEAPSHGMILAREYYATPDQVVVPYVMVYRDIGNTTMDRRRIGVCSRDELKGRLDEGTFFLCTKK